MKFRKFSILMLLPVVFIVMAFFFQSLNDDTSIRASEDTAADIHVDEAEIETENNAEEEQKEPEPVPYEGEFELPVEGAAGYSSIELPLYASPSQEADVQIVLVPGSAFMILSEEGVWWKVQTEELTGWVEHKYAFINLPDVIPSIVYDNTNSYDSIFTSSKQEIPNLTNETLYQSVDYNERLEEETFIMPILYAAAKKVNAAQQLALANGEALKIYETFRPYDTQQRIVDSLAAFAKENEAVHAGLNRGPWSQGWFIITDSVSNHQVGAAMDVSLVSIGAMEEKIVGDYIVPKVSEYTELEMQTPMHELSSDSVIYEKAIPFYAKTELLAAPLIDTMTEPAIRLQQYAKEAGFTPIASEWWHFNDLEAAESLGELSGTGEFHITQTLNSQPVNERNVQ